MNNIYESERNNSNSSDGGSGIRQEPPSEHVMQERLVAPGMESSLARLGEGPTDAPPRPDTKPEEELSRRLSELERLVQQREEDCRALIRDRELATVLACRPLLPGAAAQLLKLLRDEFEVLERDGQPLVYSRDGQPLAQAVPRLLARPEFAHFCLPTTRGGVTNPSPVPVSNEGEARAPETLGELIVQRWRQAAASSPPQRPLGLRRRMH